MKATPKTRASNSPALKLVEPDELDNETRIAQVQLEKHKAKVATHQRLMEEHQALVKHHQAQVEELQNRLNPPKENPPKPAVNFMGIPVELLHRWTLETPRKKPLINWNKNFSQPKRSVSISADVMHFLGMIERTKSK